MHYCFFSSGSWQGNASIVRMRELGNEFIRRGHTVSYVLDDVAYNREKHGLNRQANLAFTSNPGSPSQIATRRKLLNNLAPDFVHVLNPSVKAWLALGGISGRRVVGDWDEWPARRVQLPLHQRLRERYLDRWLRNRSALVVVCSRYLQRAFKNEFGLDSTYIPYATYLNDYPDGESPYAQPTAVYMGSFYPIYDHDLLLEAAVVLRDRGLRPHLALVGDGEQMGEMREFVSKNYLTESVHLVGYQGGEALWRHLRHARVLLFPIRETLLNLCRCPSKTFAYVQARRPVIANKVGEVAEVLGERALRYVEPTPHGFADAIADAMSPQFAVGDVDYELNTLTWAARADALLEGLGRVNR